MTITDFQEQAIDLSIAAAKQSYSKPEDKQKHDGAMAGLESCRHKSPKELAELLEMAKCARIDAYREEAGRYWWFACYAGEVEWICNVVSAQLHRAGQPAIVPPTVRAFMLGVRILGVKGEAE